MRKIDFKSKRPYKMKTVSFLIEKVEGGYTAYAQDYSILAEGDTLEETYKDATEAFEDQCEYLNESPNDYRIEFKYDLPTLFEVYKIVNVAALAERLHMNNSLISQYVTGKKEPSAKQKLRIEQGLHEFARELLKFSFA